MAFSSRYTRLLLDYWLVTSDTSSIEFNRTRADLPAPTHEQPSAFVSGDPAGELTIQGYIANLPNAYVLEKQLQGIFADPDSNHYFHLIPDYRDTGTGWDATYMGLIKSSNVTVEAKSASLVTISGSMTVISYTRAAEGAGPGSKAQQAGQFRGYKLLYKSDLDDTGGNAYTDYIEVGALGAVLVTVVAWDIVGSAQVVLNVESSATGVGTGTDLIVAGDVTLAAKAINDPVECDMGTDTYVRVRYDVTAAEGESISFAVFVAELTD